ncbi:MAG: hypothetical protein K2X74_10770, partial [Acetobacteraceae bacterium]|nr:hypothetical protein [Acetobacteraceae bacterium]
MPAHPAVPAATAVTGGLEGFIAPRRILGWAADPDHPAEPVALLLRHRGEAQARLVTGAHGRPDLFTGRDPVHGVLLDLP